MKFDSSKIENFNTLSADELRARILEMDFPDISGAEYDKLKAAFNKASSELAEAKKTIRAGQNADEVAKAEREAAEKAKDELIANLQRRMAVSDAKERLVALGFDAKLASDTAELIADGKTDDVFGKLTEFKVGFEKAIRADIAKNAPKPDGAGSGTDPADKAVELAAKLGKERAASISAASDVLSKYAK